MELSEVGSCLCLPSACVGVSRGVCGKSAYRPSWTFKLPLEKGARKISGLIATVRLPLINTTPAWAVTFQEAALVDCLEVSKRPITVGWHACVWGVGARGTRDSLSPTLPYPTPSVDSSGKRFLRLLFIMLGVERIQSTKLRDIVVGAFSPQSSLAR